jgi:acyl-CoA hydrolase
MNQISNSSDLFLTEAVIVQHRIVMRRHLNDQGNLFGGQALKWMDEVAYITASRDTGQIMVTVSIEKVRFFKPISEGSILQISGKVVSAGAVKSTVAVCIWVEDPGSRHWSTAIVGNFIFAAVDETGKAVRRRTSNVI